VTVYRRQTTYILASKYLIKRRNVGVAGRGEEVCNWGANVCPIFFVPKISNIFGYCVEDGQIKII